MSSSLTTVLSPRGEDDGECGEPHDPTARASAQLTLAMVLCFVFMIAEVVGGYFAGSLAIMTECVAQAGAAAPARARRLPSALTRAPPPRNRLRAALLPAPPRPRPQRRAPAL